MDSNTLQVPDINNTLQVPETTLHIKEEPEAELQDCPEAETIQISGDPEKGLKDCPSVNNDEDEYSQHRIREDEKESKEEGYPLDDDDLEEENPLQYLIAPLISIFQLVIRSSYIATNIVMMVSEFLFIFLVLG